MEIIDLTRDAKAARSELKTHKAKTKAKLAKFNAKMCNMATTHDAEIARLKQKNTAMRMQLSSASDSKHQPQKVDAETQFSRLEEEKRVSPHGRAANSTLKAAYSNCDILSSFPFFFWGGGGGGTSFSSLVPPVTLGGSYSA